MPRKMADRKCQLFTPEEISNYFDDLESDFDTSSSSDDTNFESKYFLSFLEPFHGSLKADMSWFVSQFAYKN